MKNINVQISENSITKETCDALIVFIPEKGNGFESFQTVDKKLKNKLSEVIKEEHFQGKPGESLVFHTNGALNAARVIVTGLGPKEKINEESIRRSSAAGALAARNAACANVSYSIPAETGINRDRLVQIIVEGALLATYRFIKFKTKEEELQPQKKIQSISLLTESSAALKSIVSRAVLYAESTAFARDLVNEPANTLNPEVLANIAKKVAEESGLEYRVIEAPELHFERSLQRFPH